MPASFEDNAPETWIVQDWMSNVLFGGRTFESFEDGWGFVYEQDPQPEGNNDDHYYDDYYVVPATATTD